VEILSQRKLGERLKDMGLVKTRTSGGVWIRRGIAIKRDDAAIDGVDVHMLPRRDKGVCSSDAT
jgi:hypothetical protein